METPFFQITKTSCLFFFVIADPVFDVNFTQDEVRVCVTCYDSLTLMANAKADYDAISIKMKGKSARIIWKLMTGRLRLFFVALTTLNCCRDTCTLLNKLHKSNHGWTLFVALMNDCKKACLYCCSNNRIFLVVK